MAQAKTKQTGDEFESAVAEGTKVAEQFVKANTDAAMKGYETVVANCQEAFDACAKAGTDVKGFEKVAAYPKANFDAFAEAGTVFARGVEQMNARFLEMARSAVEDSVATQKALMGAKTPQQAYEIQQAFVKKSFERVVNDGTAVQNEWIKLANETSQPIASRFNAAVKDIAKSA